MKKLVLFTCASILALNSFSQGNVVFKDSLKNLMGDTIVFQHDINDADLPPSYEIAGFISNVSGTSIDIVIRRVVVQYIATASDQICWANTCIAYHHNNLDINTGNETIDANYDYSLTDLGVFHYIHQNQVGTSILKYYLMNGDVAEDSLVAVYTLTGPKVTLTFKVNMSTLPDFDPTEKVYVEGTFGDQIQMVSTNNINYFVSLPVDLNTTYTYKYSTDTYSEPGERTISISDANVTLNDNMGVVGIHQNKISEMMSSPYPNPVINSTSINYNIPKNQHGNLVVVNAIGKKVRIYNLTDSNGKIEINMSTLPSGIYFVNLEQNGLITTSRKIIKR